MSNSVFQNVIYQLKETTDRTIGVVDSDGYVISCTDSSLRGEHWLEPVHILATEGLQYLQFGEKTFRSITGPGNLLEYAVFCTGEDELARTFCSMACVALNDSKNFYEKKHDRGTFIKNILMDNILPGDIYGRAKELHFSTEAPRAVLLVRQVGRGEVAAVDVISRLFPDRTRDFVISINESDIAVVKQLPARYDPATMNKMAVSIENALKSDLYIKTVIGIGTVAAHMRELADSYKEAQTAIEVGKVFDTEKTIVSYENLGIGRLIYQLPTTLCEIFLSEIFTKSTIDALDQETLFTINKFFENSLNVSETSRKLFVHRNTLVYRLEKIKKVTGLDLRLFDHAIVFKVALMVRKYLASRENR